MVTLQDLKLESFNKDNLMVFWKSNTAPEK